MPFCILNYFSPSFMLMNLQKNKLIKQNIDGLFVIFPIILYLPYLVFFLQNKSGEKYEINNILDFIKIFVEIANVNFSSVIKRIPRK